MVTSVIHIVPRSIRPRRWLVESSFMMAKGSPSSGTTATIGRSQGCTSTWKFVAHWKKSLVRKASASSPFATIMRRISPRRYSKVVLVRNAMGRLSLTPVTALDEGGGDEGEHEGRGHQHEGERAAEGPVRLADDLLVHLRAHDVEARPAEQHRRRV